MYNMTTTTAALACLLMVLLFFQPRRALASSRGSWEQIGQTIDAASHLNYSTNGAVDKTTMTTPPSPSTTAPWTVDLSEDGRRLAVGGGSSNGSIQIYDLVITTAPSSASTNDVQVASWRLSGILNGATAGGRFSLSPDGRMLAARMAPDMVRVYQIIVDATNSTQVSPASPSSMRQIGNDVWCLEDGESVKLALTGSGSYFLAMGCESYLNNLGRVQVLELTSIPMDAASQTLSYYWNPFLPSLKGRNTGDQFGAVVSIVPAPSAFSQRAFRIAIGSPGYNQGQGMVQVYTASNDRTGWTQVGDDLTGASVGERFGASLDMSSNELPYLLVGAPGWTANRNINYTTTTSDSTGSNIDKHLGRGLVRLYHWQSRTFGGLRRWTLVDDSLVGGRQEGDRFGTAVAISRTGERVVAASPLSPTTSSGNVIDDAQNSSRRAYVGVYERESYSQLGGIVNDLLLGQRPLDAWGQSVAVNKYASMVVSVSSRGNVRSFLDDSAFCGIPPSVDNGISVAREEKVMVDGLLDRQACRDFDVLVTTELACGQQNVFIQGDYVPCVWRSSELAWGAIPTPSPTSMPSQVAPSTSEPYTSHPSSHIENPPTEPLGLPHPSEAPSEGMYLASASPSVTSPTPPGTTSAPTRVFPPSTEPSSRQPSSQHEDDDGEEVLSNSVSACRCDSSNHCTDNPLRENDLVLRVCVFVSSTAQSTLDGTMLSLNECILDQDELKMNLISNGRPTASETSLECTGRQGLSSPLSPSNCAVETIVESIFFGSGRPSYVDVRGRVVAGKASLERKMLRAGHSRNLQEALAFSTRIVLSRNEDQDAAGSGDEEVGQVSSIVFWILVGLVLVALVMAWRYYKVRRQRNATATSTFDASGRVETNDVVL